MPLIGMPALTEIWLLLVVCTLALDVTVTYGSLQVNRMLLGFTIKQGISGTFSFSFKN